jgi:glutamate/tyrosine decarboxylase-like PLP-dependent enzyme
MNQALPASDADLLLSELLSTDSPLDSPLPSVAKQLLREANSHHGDNWAAHMTPNLAPYSLLGVQLAALHQGNMLSAALYPQLALAERETLNWLKACFDMPFAHFSHGGSGNNLQALWQARDHHNDGRKKVYASRASHYSVAKACKILGLELTLIDTDDRDRLCLDSLKSACQNQPPLAIMLNAGTSAMGAMDPLTGAAAISRDYQSWLHIDASWGGATLMLPEQAELRQVLAEADSLCFDPHKSLFQPRPCSLYLSRLALGQSSSTDYLASAPTERLTGSYGGELFLPLWLNLRCLGETWFLQQTRQRLAQAAIFSQWLERQDNVAVFDGGTGIVCFEAKGRPLDSLVSSGVLSEAIIQDRAVYRAVFAGFDTRAERLISEIRPFL